MVYSPPHRSPGAAMSPLLPLLLACAPEHPPEPGPPRATHLAGIDRTTFNQQAIEQHVPVHWAHDTDSPGELEAHEVVAVWSDRPLDWKPAEDGVLSPQLFNAVARFLDPPAGDPEDAARQALLADELLQGHPTLLEADLGGLSPGEQEALRKLTATAPLIERLYALQRGVADVGDAIPAGDTRSRAVFFRNQGPWCNVPGPADDPASTAVPPPQGARRGRAPHVLQPIDDEGVVQSTFCEALDQHHPDLLTPFSVVRGPQSQLKSVPYPDEWPQEHRAIATLLDEAAQALPPEEAALAAYLRAASQAFGDNDWFAADAAWAAMNARNSGWYVRIGPDETYFDPCGHHAGYHLVLARINPDSLAWQDRLDPLKQDMEAAAAAWAGQGYTARAVDFTLPDFIDIVLNAGDSRADRGATIGQSLPNWGPVADAGGRTVAMTNIGIDPDSVSAHRDRVSSLFCGPTMADWTDDHEPLLVSTILHEAAHNLGPSGNHSVDGESPEQRFGGGLAGTLEELKAQTAALALTDWLGARGVISPETVRQSHLADVGWAFGQISHGMSYDDGTGDAYARLSAIQLGALQDAGAVRWEAETLAANGTDMGCFSVDQAALPAAIESLTTEVFGIKARGDRAAAEALRDRHIFGERTAQHDLIGERWRRAPSPAYLYRLPD